MTLFEERAFVLCHLRNSLFRVAVISLQGLVLASLSTVREYAVIESLIVLHELYVLSGVSR